MHDGTIVGSASGRTLNFSDEPWLFADISDGDNGGAEVRSVIHFPDVIGPGEGQVRRGSHIHWAYVTFHVANAGGSVGLHEITETWDPQTVSWMARGEAEGNWTEPGIDPPSATQKALHDFTTSVGEPVEVNVKVALSHWVEDPSHNKGFVLIPGSSDGTDIYSSEAEDPDLRPVLLVEFTPSEGDTGTPPDTGPTDTGPPDTGPEQQDTGPEPGTPGGRDNNPPAEEDAGCGCAVGAPVGPLGALFVAVLALGRRRRSPTAACLP